MTDSVALLRWTCLVAIPVATFISLVAYVFLAPNAPDEGKLKLPLHGERERQVDGYSRIDAYAEEDGDENDDEVTQEDPFDISDDEVALDGHPIQEEAFWRKVRATWSERS
jgi:hypothetical protein